MIRRYAPIKSSHGTVWPSDVLRQLRERDRMCVGAVIGMPGNCYGMLEPDHVRASGGMGTYGNDSKAPSYSGGMLFDQTVTAGKVGVKPAVVTFNVAAAQNARLLILNLGERAESGVVQVTLTR